MDDIAAWVAWLSARACDFNATCCGPGRVLRDRGALEGACGRPFAGFGGHELYDTMPAKAVALLTGVALAHPFDDGNKRTAWAVMGDYLAAFGLECDWQRLDPCEIETIVIGLITGDVSETDATKWLARHLIALRG
ncbi:Fic family protein [Nanchangia anserum]|uniref:Fic family protein n=1 Tax=Nanchangia anserum TaxID=2692125 RepID=A0A8I0GCY4_9ACTO|nr:Fic family protein [Nanchangia anserum]MBD3689860.1 Fic family protein [Nanchangia anserum]QOX82027.1 Fic family protein [Nanchangia anserum]